MVAGHGDWGGSLLLLRLVNNLRPDDGALDLYVHSLSALFQQRPYLVEHDLALAKAITDQATNLLLHAPPALSRQSVVQLERLRFAVSLLSK
jgi:hypothetical protein